MVLFKDKFISISYKENDKMLYAAWTNESEYLPEAHFQKINEMYLDFIEKYQIKTFLLNTEKFLFTISVELQQWVGEYILPNLKAKGLHKAAFIVSKEFIAQLSIELTMQENPALMSVAYFDNEEEAEKWLIGITTHQKNLQQF